MTSSHPEHNGTMEVVANSQERGPRFHAVVDEQTRSMNPVVQKASENRENRVRDKRVIASSTRRSSSHRTIMRSKVDFVESSGKIPFNGARIRSSSEDGAPAANDSCSSLSKVVKFCNTSMRSSTSVVREVVKDELGNHRSSSLASNTHRTLKEHDRRDDTTEEDGTDSSPSAEQLEWLLDWLSSSSTTSEGQDLSSVEEFLHRNGNGNGNEVGGDENFDQKDGEASVEPSLSMNPPCTEESTGASRSKPLTPSGSEEVGECVVSDDFDPATASVAELREAVLNLQGTVKHKDDEIMKMTKRLNQATEKHAERENEFNGLVDVTEKLSRKLKRSSSNDKKRRKQISRLTRQMKRMELELQEADEICELFNLQMEKIQASFEAERNKLKQEAEAKAVDYEAAIAKLLARVSDSEQKAAQESYPKECCSAIHSESKVDGKRENANSRCLKFSLAARRSSVPYFCLLLFILLALCVRQCTLPRHWREEKASNNSDSIQHLKQRVTREEKRLYFRDDDLIHDFLRAFDF